MRKESQMLNRTTAPDFNSIKELHLISPDKLVLENGIQTFVFQANELDLLKFEFIFKNIYHTNSNPMLNPALSAMMKEGTSTLTSAQIAEQIDFYGAYLMPEFSYDYTSITLYTTNKYVDKALPIVSSIIKDSIIPQQELDTYIRNNKQSLQISLKKNDVVARRLFYQNVFGENQYGTVASLEGYNTITREKLLELYCEQITPANCTIMVAGRVDTSVLDLIKIHFNDNWRSDKLIYTDSKITFPETPSHLIVETKDDALQSAVRLGGVSINRKHSDFPAVQFVNTLLGGFFGSRLMKNIREEKGYTYSIGSSVASLQHTGFFTLASEVGVEVTKNTLAEIQNEFDILRQERATVEEVELVRNYLLGSVLGSLESIFSHMDKFKAVYFYGMDLSYYQYYNDVVNQMDTSKVQDIAIRYFDYDQLLKIVVGKLD